MIRSTPAECSGCSACYAVCPVDAISMIGDEEGFLYPSIDREKCINCGLCRKVCPFHEEYPKADGALEISEYYAMVHSDAAVRTASRSGGAFAAMASAVLSWGGSVYGAALDEEFCVYTSRITEVAQLPLLQGSKYVQSDKRGSFRQVKQDLAAGKCVLFSGTGCEVSGLIAYLRHTKTCTDTLYTCDVVCHGVPSPLLWKENLTRIEKRLGGKPDSVCFRDKRFGWHAHIESYKKGSKEIYDNQYTSLFYSHNCLRPSCSSCRFCNYDRCGDVTIADFWGCEKMELPEDLTKGISLLMVNTAKGKELLNAVSPNARLFPARKEQTLQPNLQNPTAPSSQRNSFWADYRARGYNFAVRKHTSFTGRLSLLYNLLFRRKHI